MNAIRNISKPMISMYALKGKFGGVTYFMATLPLSECDQLHYAKTNQASEFSERVQRRLNQKRANEIYENYLVKEGIRFFNSLVVVLTPKDTTKTGYYSFEAFEDESGVEIGQVGTLNILSDIDRVVVDGQHRLYALKKANEFTREPSYNSKLELHRAEVPIVFVTFDDVGGVYVPGQNVENIVNKVAEHSRKVFIDLNKNAKGVDKNSLLILDDSDFSAIAARYIIEDNENLERYTKWSEAGLTLADADPYFTNISLLHEFVDKVLEDEDLKNEIEKCNLSVREGREKALERYFLSGIRYHDGLIPKNMINEFFEKIEFFGQWRERIRKILSDDPPPQPEPPKLNRGQRREIKTMRQRFLLATVAGQKVAFGAALEAYPHFGSEDPQENWTRALEQLSKIHTLGLLNRSKDDNLWQNLLLQAENKMKVNRISESTRILRQLMIGEPEDRIHDIHPDDDIGTANTLNHYGKALTKLRSSKSLGSSD